MAKYVPELDGIRAFAVLPVLLFHLKVPGFGLGWGGVQLFFVLSGYLITGILLESKPQPHFFRNFYVRRSLRIFPIYYALLLAILAVAVARSLPFDDAAWFFTYLQNYRLGLDNFGPRFPLLFNHTWSLAVEEQFYLLWPLATWLLSRRRLGQLAVALVVVGAVARLLFVALGARQSLIFTPLVSQVDALGAGASLAILRRSGVERGTLIRLSTLALGLGGAYIVGFLAWRGVDVFYAEWARTALDTLLWSALALASAGAVGLTICLPGTPLGALLRQRPLVYIGRISYGLYLYHYPIFLLANSLERRAFGHALSPLPHGVFCFAATGLVAAVSFRTVEKMFLELKDKWAPAVAPGQRLAPLPQPPAH